MFVHSEHLVSILNIDLSYFSTLLLLSNEQLLQPVEHFLHRGPFLYSPVRQGQYPLESGVPVEH